MGVEGYGRALRPPSTAQRARLRPQQEAADAWTVLL